jgi:hypothetical protein
MNRRRIWLRGILALLAVWALAAIGIWAARSQRMTAEKTIAYAHDHSFDGLSAADRLRIIDGLADRVNRLTYEERQKFRQQGDMRKFFETMTDTERAHYLDLTLPKGFKQMMEAFNDMQPAQRKQIVNRALADLSRARENMDPNDHDHLHTALSDQSTQRIINEGMKSFLSDANAATKIDLQPLIEQMQAIMQTGH